MRWWMVDEMVDGEMVDGKFFLISHNNNDSEEKEISNQPTNEEEIKEKVTSCDDDDKNDKLGKLGNGCEKEDENEIKNKNESDEISDKPYGVIVQV